MGMLIPAKDISPVFFIHAGLELGAGTVIGMPLTIYGAGHGLFNRTQHPDACLIRVALKRGREGKLL